MRAYGYKIPIDEREMSCCTIPHRMRRDMSWRGLHGSAQRPEAGGRFDRRGAGVFVHAIGRHGEGAGADRLTNASPRS